MTNSVAVNDTSYEVDPQILRDVLDAQIRKTRVAEHVWICPICECRTDNLPMNSTCRPCHLAGGYTDDPLTILGRAFGWKSGIPVDLLDVLQAGGATVAELLAICHTQEDPQPALCLLWDTFALEIFPTEVLAITSFKDDTKSTGTSWKKSIVPLQQPEAPTIRFRPRSRVEKAAIKLEQDRAYEADKIRVREAHQAARIRAFEALQKEVESYAQ